VTQTRRQAHAHTMQAEVNSFTFSPLASFVPGHFHSAAFVYYISPQVGGSTRGWKGWRGRKGWKGMGPSVVPSLKVELHRDIYLRHFCYPSCIYKHLLFSRLIVPIGPLKLNQLK